MKKLKNLHNYHIYFIGIGGISMSGLCKLSLKFGAKVSGSDLSDNPEIHKLKALGVNINNNHNADNITPEYNLVVYTSAISADNQELLRAKELGIKTIERSEFLGFVASCFPRVIAVAGTHGKTTTTAMISEILTLANFSPTIHIGGESIGLKDNTLIGNSDILVVEACEYKESFRYLKPFISVITNVELDHLDYYKDMLHIIEAFQKFANNSKTLIMPNNISISHSNPRIIFDEWQISQLEFVAGGYNFNVYYKGELFETFRINMLGYHNVINALFAIAVAYELNIDKSIISSAISSFQGVERRYETIKVFPNKCRVIIDYAHHPTEIETSYNGIEGIYNKSLVIFQPHTYSRTLKLFDEFVDVLSKINNLIVYQTYPAREETIEGGTAFDLYKKIKHSNSQYFDNIQCLVSYINSNSENFDCVLVLGAGDLAEKLKRYYASEKISDPNL